MFKAPSKDDEYPPLPEYTTKPEIQAKEALIVQVRGLPWSCTAEDLIHFFSGTCFDSLQSLNYFGDMLIVSIEGVLTLKILT